MSQPDLSRDPPSGRGRGLAPGPVGAGALTANLAGYVDYLDARGAWIGTGPQPPPGTSYIRRWSIQPLSAPADDTLALAVMVVATRALRGPPTRSLRPNDPGVTWVATLRTRR